MSTQLGGTMENDLPSVVLKWVQEGKINLSYLPDNSLKLVMENSEFLQDLCGMSGWELGKLLFPHSSSKSSQQTQTAKLLSRGSLQEVARVPEVLGFDRSIVLTMGLRQKVVDHVKTMGAPKWEESVFSVQPICGKCGTASLIPKAKFCANCGKKL